MNCTSTAVQPPHASAQSCTLNRQRRSMRRQTAASERGGQNVCVLAAVDGYTKSLDCLTLAQAIQRLLARDLDEFDTLMGPFRSTIIGCPSLVPGALPVPFE